MHAPIAAGDRLREVRFRLEGGPLPSEQRDIADGTLVVRTDKQQDTHVIALCGELDLANSATAEAELKASLELDGAEVIVDMRELEFIDSTGIALLVAALG